MNSQTNCPVQRGARVTAVLVAAFILITGNLALAGSGQPAAGTDPAPSVAAAHVAAGEYHTCAVTTGGAVLCWGSNTEGQLGDLSRVDRFAPVYVQGLLGPAAAVAAGDAHSCALMRNGSVNCWGGNHAGQLGDGTTTDRRSAVSVRGLMGVVALAAGRDHTCALTSAGAVKCWGANDYGQLGNASLKGSLVPGDVSGLAAGAVRLGAGALHTCAAMDEANGGGVRCWGVNQSGQLGDGTPFDRVTPVPVNGLTGVMRTISARAGHTCAVTAAGTVKCWGNNGWGQLGDGTTVDRTTPVDVAGLPGAAASVAAGGYHTCAVTEVGAALCWGENWEGPLGDGSTTGHLTPVPVSGLSSDVQMLAAGTGHSCALMSGGALKCWGYDGMGALGTGTGGGRYPVDAGPLDGGARVADTGEYHSCAVTAASGVKCWGRNDYGQLGDGTHDTRYRPVDVMELTSGTSAVAVGGAHSCALTAAGGVKCWGANGYGQLGNGSWQDKSVPGDVPGLPAGIVAVAAGGAHSCALTAAGGVMCWGRGFWSTPGLLVESGVTAIAAGGRHTCVLTTAGGMQCQGANDFGQLGNMSNGWGFSLTDVYGLASGVTAIAAGGDHTCALLQGGALKCWGRNDHGQVGDGTTRGRVIPKNVSGLESGVIAVGAGANHTCAVTAGGGVKCWGSNQSGQLGDGSRDDRITPIDVHGLVGGAVSVSGGGDYNTGYYSDGHSCALVQAGDTAAVKCWGRNDYGQLGDGAGHEPIDVVGFEGEPVTPSPTPTAMATLTPSATPTETPSPTSTPTPAAAPALWLPVIHGQARPVEVP